MFKRLLSSSLACLLFANLFCATPRAELTDENIPTSPTSRSMLSAIKNHPKTSVAASLLAVGGLSAAGYLIYKCATHVPKDYLYKKLSEPTNQVTADDWFYRLGGTQDDINSYIRLVNNYNSSQIESPFDCTITNDVDRYPFQCVPGATEQSNDFKDIFNRILKIYYATHPKAHYTQGWDDVAYMIYHKFMVTRNTQQPLSIEDEAKVCFVYNKFMNMLNYKFGDVNTWDPYMAQHFQQPGSIRVTENDFQGFAIHTIFSHGVLTAGTVMFIRAGLMSKIIDMWDRIITDDKFVSPMTHDFNMDLVLDQLNQTICSMLCERGRDGDALRREISGKSARATCSGRTLTMNSQ